MARSLVSTARIKKFNAESFSDADDLLAEEEPFEIRLGYGLKNDRKLQSISVTMRTPGNDFELALGFLFTEGIIQNQKDILKITYCTDSNRVENRENIVRVELKPDVEVNLKKTERNFYVSSSCGVCGKASIEAIDTVNRFIHSDVPVTIETDVLIELPQKLKQSQPVFEYTGGLHASALFNTNGDLIAIREDVGRHNALDKIIGASFSSNQLPLDNAILLLSGRASFELIQKAVMAGIRIVAAIGAPSSLAVATAKKFDVTLIGFLRGQRFNIYSGEKRVIHSSKQQNSNRKQLKEIS